MKKILSGQGTLQQEQVLLVIGAVLILIHSVDDWIALEVFDMAPWVITVIAVVAAALYRVLPWFIFVPVAIFVAVTRAIGGALHIVSLASGDPEGGDYTGIFELIGALIFIAIAVVVLRRKFGGRRNHDASSDSATTPL